jgi:hypothetical protein
MRRFGFVPLLMLALVFLAADCDGDVPPASKSGIEGAVLIGPMCPVERQDSPCPDQPFEATIVIEDGAGNEVARTTSGADGRFRVHVGPGVYTLVPLPPNEGAPPFAAEQLVEVPSSGYVQVSVSYDSGLR